jgi:hypothetical protein
VIVSSQVDQELTRGRARGCDVPELRAQPWIEIRSVALAHDYPELGPGESGALDLARALPDAIVILDDGAARAWAARLSHRSLEHYRKANEAAPSGLEQESSFWSTIELEMGKNLCPADTSTVVRPAVPAELPPTRVSSNFAAWLFAQERTLHLQIDGDGESQVSRRRRGGIRDVAVRRSTF